MFFWAPSLGCALTEAANGADIIHSHGLFNAPTWQAHRTARRRGRPLIVSVRGMLESGARRHHALRKRAAWTLFDRRVCAEAAILHTTSAQETASVSEAAPHARIAQIPNAVDVAPPAVTAADRRRIRSRLDQGGESPFILFLGRLHPIKRLDLLAAAFAAVADRHPDVRLVIAGDGDAAVRARADAALGASRARTTWLGAVGGRERDALLAEASALVLCSDSENFGMSVAEALAFGVVPVVTRTCPWDVLEQEGAGFWVPQTADAIADALLQLLTSPQSARAMGERGRQVAARFSPGAIGALWATEYRQLVA
jgi:glycosyltransferase involved in cell wall biosynthesis